jgi:very-short-patch-repair endonuclease
VDRFYKPPLTTSAKRLRQEMTPSEKRLWSYLRKNRFSEFRFRRQQPIGPYIVDFFCAESRLVVELDGESHTHRGKADIERDEYMEKQGLEIVRVWDSQFFENPDGIVELILRKCCERKLSPQRGKA